MNSTNIAKKIISYRSTKKLTIQQMAKETGLSTALISQLERNLANPSLSVLQTLANTLGISLSELVEGEMDENSLILRVAHREQVYNPNDKYMFYNLTPAVMKSNINLSLVHLEPFSQTFGREFHCHKDEEMIFIVAGSVTVEYGGSQVELYCGDTLRIPGNKKHRYKNNSQEIVEILAIKTNRSY